MTLKIIAVMGEPGSGKSTLMTSYIDSYPNGTWEPRFDVFPLVPFHLNQKDGIYILGKYEEGEKFGGTDRMSMAVQPKAIEFLNELSSDKTVIFEGDRLTNQSFLEHCIDNFDTSVIYLSVNAAERERRYVERGSNQSETFLKGRITKYERLRANFSIMMITETMEHMTPEDTTRAIALIKSKVQ